MKLDYDLIRSLLLAIEEHTDGFSETSREFYYMEFPSTPESSVRYHMKYLADVGYIQVSCNYEHVIDITPRGREYLDSIRDQGVWEEVKKKLQPFSSVPSDILVALAKDAFSHLLGLHGTV